MDGMSEEAFFFDSYALFEMVKGNPNFEKYRKNTGIVTVLNLIEFNYGLKKEIDSETADILTEKYLPAAVEIGFSEIKEAASLKIRKKELSHPDAIGYVVAKKHKVRFLTGDEAFRNMPNVEFVKK
jgi:predicted nucleic acid-binding protein